MRVSHAHFRAAWRARRQCASSARPLMTGIALGIVITLAGCKSGGD